MSSAYRIGESAPERPEHDRDAPPRVDVPALAPAPGLSVARILHLQGTAGNRAVARLVGLPSTASLDEESFNPDSIVNDLRRAIDQSDVRLMGYKTVETSFLPRQDPIFQRFISGPEVVKALDNLTAAQIQRVREGYQAQEKRSLDEDLFGNGESGYPSDLTVEERGHIGALLGGTRAEAAQAGGPKPETPEGRFEADAIVLHGLLDDDLKGANLEKVMAMHRRPGREIDRVDSHYARRYGKELGFVLGDKLEGLQRSRMYFLRGEDWAKADACAIEAKRQAILTLEASRPDDLLSSAVSFASGPSANTGAIIDAGKKALEGDIEQILEQNKREAIADPANAGKSAEQAVQERLSAILSVKGPDPSKTLGEELASTLGPARGGTVNALLQGDLVRAAGSQMLALETSKSISSDKIAVILRGLRTQAVHDMQARALDPKVSVAEKERMIASPDEAIDGIAKAYTADFVRIYDEIRGEARSWREIVASADEENQPMLIALVRGGGKMLEVEELEFAIRRKNVDAIKDVLRRQPTKAKIDDLVAQYELANGAGSLKTALYGATGDATFAANAPKKYNRKALLHGRDAAHAAESLARPATLGGEEEARWLADYGQWEVDVTEFTAGLMGWLRELGDVPETQLLMEESAKRLKTLLAEFQANDPWGRPRAQILVEMRRVRGALTGDAAAYEEENEAIVAKLKAAVTFAVQVALALALPGVGLGFIGTMALNIGATVATNMMIQGDDYNLTSLRNDVIGGVLGGLGGKFGEEVVGAIASSVTKGAANATVQAAERAGLGAATLAKGAGTATVSAAEQSILVMLAKEGGNLVGSTAGTTVATGENGFTAEGMLQNIFMSVVGKFAPGPKGTGPKATAEGGTPPGSETVRPGGGEPTTSHPVEGAHGKPVEGGPVRADAAETAKGSGEPTARPQGEAPVRAGEETHRPAGTDAPVDPIRAGTAHERLEARRIVNSLEVLGSHWPGMTTDARLESLTAISNRVLQARGIPNVKVVEGAQSGGGAAHLEFKNWTIVVDPAYVQTPQLPGHLVEYMSALGRHEVEPRAAVVVDGAAAGHEGPRRRVDQEPHGPRPRRRAAGVRGHEARRADERGRAGGGAGRWDSVYGKSADRREWDVRPGGPLRAPGEGARGPGAGGGRARRPEARGRAGLGARDRARLRRPLQAPAGGARRVPADRHRQGRGAPARGPAPGRPGGDRRPADARLGARDRGGALPQLGEPTPADPALVAEHQRELDRLRNLEERRDTLQRELRDAERVANEGQAAPADADSIMTIKGPGRDRGEQAGRTGWRSGSSAARRARAPPTRGTRSRPAWTRRRPRRCATAVRRSRS